MLSVLTETQKAIVETITLRLLHKQALLYLEEVGFPMSRAKYFRQKKKIEDMKLERMQHIAMYFQDQHLERIDKCEHIEKLMWENYRTGDIKRVNILNSIMNMQSWLSAYYDATRYVLEKKVKTYTDFMKTPRTYCGIDVLENRKKEVEKEELDFYHKRELEVIAENNKPIVRDSVPAIVDGDEEKDDNGLPGIGGEGSGPIVQQPSPSNELKPRIVTPHSSSVQEQEPEEEEEHEETESERHWRTHPIRRRHG